MSHIRKIAAHRILFDGKVLKMFVVEVIDGKVSDFRQLQGEEAYTEWLGGDIELKKNDDGDLLAYHNGIRLT